MSKAGQISQTTIEILIVTGIVILINIFGQYFYDRLDITEDQQFTLASSSRELVSNLPDRVYIKVYISPELPPQLAEQEQKLRDLLDEYRASASNMLSIQFIHPENLGEEELNAINQKGIQELQYRIREDESAQSGLAYMGMEIKYFDSAEVIPVIPNVPSLEYAITSSILKLTVDELPTIGFLIGHGEPGTAGFQTMTDELKNLYSVRDIDLGNGQKVPVDVDTLIIANPTGTFTQRHKYVIDQFVMRGGKLVVMMSGVAPDQMSGQMQMSVNPLESLLTDFGVKINSDLVIDTGYNLSIQTGQQIFGMPLTAPYPLAPQIISSGFDPDAAATRGLSSLGLPYVSSLELLYDKIDDEAEIFELCRTSERSYSHPPPMNLDPSQQFLPPGGESEYGKQLVAVQITGAITSGFADEPVPAYDPAPDAEAGAIPEIDTDEKLTSTELSTIVVIGNGNFVNDDNVRGIPGNAIFFLNLMEVLNLGEQLIDIRTRMVTNRPLDPDLTDADKNALKFWGYGAIPLIVTLYGVTRFYLKGQRKRLLQTMQQAEQNSGRKS